MKTCRLFLAAVLVALLAACAGNQVIPSLNRNEALYKAATQIAVLKVLEKNPTLAPRVQEIAGQAAAGLAAGEVVPLTVLEAQIRAAIKWEKLEPEEVILVDALIATVKQEIGRATADLQAPEDVRLAVVKVLGWIEAAAALSGSAS